MGCNIPNDLLFNILEFSGNKNLILVNKNFYNFILKQREFFLKYIDSNPILLKYKLIRWKQRFEEDFQYRPSMCVEDEKIFKIDSSNVGIKIGYIINNKLEYSNELENNLIPVSSINENTRRNTYAGSVLYWTIKEIKTDNLDLIKKYNILF